MEQSGLRVRRDNAGNVIGRYEAAPGCEHRPALVTGSHFDTVRNAGKYDGNLGIVLPLACIAQWHRAGKRFAFPIEVIGFAEEEGVRFKATLLGSRTVAGTFDPAVLENLDGEGISMRQAIRAAGLDPAGIAGDAWSPASVAAFVEVHRTGPAVAQRRLAGGRGHRDFRCQPLHGRGARLAGHAGTVPMHLRRDAAMAAAEIGLYIERRCGIKPGLVGTMGILEVVQGAANVVPGLASFSIDIRAEEDADRLAAVADARRDRAHRRAAPGRDRFAPDP
jgi:N-carbamoyl-L-amino-acid hydrolase